MDAAHKHLSITSDLWDSFMADVDPVFNEFKIEAITRRDLRQILADFQTQCVVQPGEAVPSDPGLGEPFRGILE